ncbi:MAG: glycogen synthase [Alphaproteobacteria bacterium]|uniref:Glycogen synthase n=1 Tax=Candidatus Nitrobium versatile TaxID=2884831 RepID=A0A953M2C8_9BACT|nr:glycogen synthase [Candidatus Nitrobium versatile]
MRIAIVAPEAVPFSKTGGLADVAGALYREFLDREMEVCLFVPLYRTTRERFGGELHDTGIDLDIPLGNAVRKCRVFVNKGSWAANGGAGDGKAGKGAVFFVGNDGYFDRDELYGTPRGDYPDNDQRFTFFCRSVLEICVRFDLSLEVIQCNDWQTGLIPLYLKTLYRDAPAVRDALSVLTIHNLGYQGLFPHQTMVITGLPRDLFSPEGVEFYGRMNFLKAGIVGADVITTVSETYAREILREESGFGLEGILRKREDRLVGIMNGIDYREWDPAADRELPRTFSREDPAGKYVCKEELMRQCGLQGNKRTPLLCFIGRLSTQKGVDILAEAIPELVQRGVTLVVIGRGDELYLTMMNSLAARFTQGFYFCSAFNESLAHLAYAGSDMFLMPSQYEPCGLGQMIAMRYGSLPVARKTGGLSDTIEDNKTGFLFADYSSSALVHTVQHALDVYAREKAWQGMVLNAMDKDFSWGKSAKTYLEMYQRERKAGIQPALRS